MPTYTNLTGSQGTLQRDEMNKITTYEVEKKRRKEPDENEKNEGEEKRGSQGDKRGENKMRQ